MMPPASAPATLCEGCGTSASAVFHDPKPQAPAITPMARATT